MSFNKIEVSEKPSLDEIREVFRLASDRMNAATSLIARESDFTVGFEFSATGKSVLNIYSVSKFLEDLNND